MSEEGTVDLLNEAKPIDNTSKTGFDIMPRYEATEEVSISALRKALREEQAEDAGKQASEETESQDEEEISESNEKPVKPKKEEDEEQETDEGDEEASEGDKEEGEDSEEELLTSDGKKFKARDVTFVVDGKEVAVPNGAHVEVVVDGKKRKVPLQEVLNRASGDLAVQNRINQVEAERVKARKEWLAKHQEAEKLNESLAERNKSLQTIGKLVKEGKAQDLLAFCALQVGGDPKEVFKKLMTESSAWGQKLAQMSEGQREVWLDSVGLALEKAQLEEERKRLQALKDKDKVATETKTVESYATEQIQKSASSSAEFRAMVTHLQKNGVALRGETPQDRIDEVLDYIHESRVVSVARSIDPGLLEKKRDLLQKVFDATLAMGIRKEAQIKRVFEEVVSSEKKATEKRIAENLSKKVRKNGVPPQTKEASVRDDKEPFTLTGFHRMHKRRF